MKNQQKRKKHYFLFTIVVTLLLFLALGGASFVARNIFAEQLARYDMQNYFLVSAAIQCILALITVFIMRRSGVYSKDEFSTRGLGKGLKLGWVCIVFSVSMFAINFVAFSQNFIVPCFLYLFACLASAFSTGLFEEILIRGFALNYLNLNMQPDKSATKKAWVLSSVIFGMVHFFNIETLDISVLISVTGQVIYAIIIGLYLGCVYLRSHNIWSVIILHALIDTTSFVLNAILSTDALIPNTEPIVASIGEQAFSQIVIPLLTVLPFLIATLVMNKKIPQKPKEEYPSLKAS